MLYNVTANDINGLNKTKKRKINMEKNCVMQERRTFPSLKKYNSRAKSTKGGKLYRIISIITLLYSINMRECEISQ